MLLWTSHYWHFDFHAVPSSVAISIVGVFMYDSSHMWARAYLCNARQKPFKILTWLDYTSINCGEHYRGCICLKACSVCTRGTATAHRLAIFRFCNAPPCLAVSNGFRHADKVSTHKWHKFCCGRWFDFFFCHATFFFIASWASLFLAA